MIALPPWTLGTALLLLGTLTVAIGFKPRETTAEEDKDAWAMEGLIAAIMAAMGIQAATLIIRATLPGF